MAITDVSTRKVSELLETNNVKDTDVLMVHDGNGLKKVKRSTLFDRDDLLRLMTPDGSGAHNAVYRGKNLGTEVTEEQWTAIEDGTFTDLYIGDYWTSGGINYRVAEFDKYRHVGGTDGKHHLVIIPDTGMYKSVFNSTRESVGYMNSTLKSTGLDNALTTVQSVFNNRVISHHERLNTAVDSSTGRMSGSSYENSLIDIPTEVHFIGTRNMGIGNSPASKGVDARYIANLQFALFRYDSRAIMNGQSTWTREPYGGGTNIVVTPAGLVSEAYVDNTDVYVRPYFCIG